MLPADGAPTAGSGEASGSGDPELAILPVRGIGEIRPGDDLVGMLATALGLDAHDPDAADGPPVPTGPVRPRLRDGDVLVVTQKVVSKAEGQLVAVDGADPDAVRALVERESVRILRRRGDLVISETAHGFICANAGIDLSNVQEGEAALLPVDADRSARRIREGLGHRYGTDVGVVVSDTFGRTWRRGVTDVALGVAGLAAVVDLRGTTDANGRVLMATEVCVADEVAAAADLVMGKDRGVPAAVVRGIDHRWFRTASVAGEVVRPPDEDLFR